MMLRKKTGSPTKHHAIFTYSEKKIPFYFWSNESTGEKPDTVIFLGTGQVGKIPRWIAESAPPGTVVIDGLPHWHSSPNGDDLADFTLSYTRHSYEAVLKTFQLSRMHIIGESQACPGVIWLANRLHKNVGNVGLILPMGLNTNSFGKTDDAKFRELRKRSLQTIMQPEQFDLRNLYAAAQLLKIVILGIKDGSTVKKYTIGISQDMINEFRTLLHKQEGRKHHVTLFIGAKDKLFPFHEIDQALKKASISNARIEVIPQKSHTSLVVRSAKSLVARAVETVRKKG